jgi:hypothetical protein
MDGSYGGKKDYQKEEYKMRTAEFFHYVDTVWGESEKAENGKRTLPGFYRNPETDVEICIFPEETRLVVAFNATESWRDVISSLFAVYKNGIHQGYLKAYESIKQKIWNAYYSHPKPIVFVGHSLGGALSQLAVLDFARKFIVTRAITTGSPRPFRNVDIPMVLYSRITSFEAHGDLVPGIPFWGKPRGKTIKVGKPTWYDWTGIRGKNHLPGHYKTFKFEVSLS